MKNEEFDALVKRLEQKAELAPDRFRLTTGLLAGFGYGYLAFVLVLSVSLTIALVWMMMAAPKAVVLKLGIFGLVITGGLALAIIRGLWVRLGAPVGLRLKREEFPELFGEIDSLRASLKSQPFHRVLLTGDYNAAVVQIPLLGVFGWHRNYLLLGLPLMMGLGADELRAVLAHEFAHLSGGHGSFGNWLYRMRRTWERVFEQIMAQENSMSWVLTKFLGWFWPRFNAHAMVLSRANEYEADACAARLVGAQYAADGLQRLSVQGPWMDDAFWPSLQKRAVTEAEPPEDLYDHMSEILRSEIPAESQAKWLRHAFVVDTNNHETHPCLRDRLSALGKLPAGVGEGRYPELMPRAPLRTAAEVYLGEKLSVVSSKLGREWADGVRYLWKETHEDKQKHVASLAEMNAKTMMSDELDVEALWKKIEAVANLEGEKAAKPLLEQVLRQKPNHPAANFLLGRIGLEQDDASAMEYLERAMVADPTCSNSAFEILHGHYARTGQKGQIDALKRRAEAHHEELELAQVERVIVGERDTFLPHELEDEELRKVIAICKEQKDIGAAHLVRKEVVHLASLPMRVLMVTVKVSWWKFRWESANEKMLRTIYEGLEEVEGGFMVRINDKSFKKVGRKIAEVPGALIYERE